MTTEPPIADGTRAESATHVALDVVAREETARILASLIRACGGDFQLAEDSLQEAMVVALERWPADGVPRAPSAWLITAARRKAIDRLRRDQTLKRKQEALRQLIAAEATSSQGDGATEMDAAVEDDRLRLIFTCCHPALSLEARVALTLRTVAGLTSAEIARAFVVPEATMAKRLARAKRKIRDAKIPYGLPPEHRLLERLSGVLAVIYLVFNEGYLSTRGAALVRLELCSEAIRLGRLLAELMPDEADALGLLALMLVHDSRRAARMNAAGEMLTLEEQDRSLWDRGKIKEGTALVERALRMRRPGAMQLQAAIAALHAEPVRAAEADWRQIVLLYGELARVQAGPVVELNRAVAVAMADGLEAGLDLIDRIDASGDLEGYHLLHASRADLLRRAGRFEDAAAAYRRAIPLCTNPVEVRYLERRLGEVAGTRRRDG